VCYAAHRVIDGVLDLRQRHGFKAADVERMVPTLSDVTARVLHRHRPGTALEAKFSIEFACAMAALEGQVGLREVTDAQVSRADVQALMTRVHARHVAPGCPIEPDFALHDAVQVHLRDGTVLDSGPIRFARGHGQLPLSTGDVAAKWHGCLDAFGDPRPQLLLSLQSLGLVGGDAGDGGLQAPWRV
jgi:2-methylcitrate dehydratase PrpD